VEREESKIEVEEDRVGRERERENKVE